TGQAPHDLALHVVSEEAAVAGQIKSDLAVGAALLSGQDRVNHPTPHRLASAGRGLDRGRRKGVVRIGKCAHDGLVFARPVGRSGCQTPRPRLPAVEAVADCPPLSLPKNKWTL